MKDPVTTNSPDSGVFETYEPHTQNAGNSLLSTHAFEWQTAQVAASFKVTGDTSRVLGFKTTQDAAPAMSA